MSLPGSKASFYNVIELPQSLSVLNLRAKVIDTRIPSAAWNGSADASQTQNTPKSRCGDGFEGIGVRSRSSNRVGFNAVHSFLKNGSYILVPSQHKEPR